MQISFLITFEGVNKMSESLAIAKRHFNSKCLDMKPDFTVMTTNSQKHVELFIVEIKLNKTNNTLISEDLVSLRKTMKYTIDKSIKDGADDLIKVACLNHSKILRLVSPRFYYSFIIVSAKFQQFRHL
ncbi:unnamed protein product [Rhizophagus irregularis]|nr:unnamed protein product [Rhizophagus irregularis]